MILNLIAGVLCSVVTSLEKPAKLNDALFPPHAPQSYLTMIQALVK